MIWGHLWCGGAVAFGRLLGAFGVVRCDLGWGGCRQVGGKGWGKNGGHGKSSPKSVLSVSYDVGEG